MSEKQPYFYYAATAATTVLVATVLSQFIEPWQAWFVGGLCGIIPLWFSLPQERRIWWKAVLAGIGAGCAAALIVYLAGK